MSEPLEPSRKAWRLGSIVRSGQGEPGRFNRALGQDPPRVKSLAPAAQVSVWLSCSGKQMQGRSACRVPVRILAQEAGMVSRREEEPSDIDVGLISGHAAKRKDWRG